ncbi:hypothetical protein LQV63_03990 [Paenibacillus profundus]|uniref:Fibronectin type III domain-containing protein n=1 Tax=Paenibacillus profundus TaxID=1173085 RepID=A0ABS8YG20_9BACL|nr:hypothetical protein [Paenibacillus profundus]MCE5168474.1 hypothetical protein [Paenibacillus profundus]
MLKELSVSILAATTLFSAGSGAVLAEPLQASTVEAKAVSQAASYETAEVRWSSVPGAAYYKIAIRDLTTNRLIVEVRQDYGNYYKTPFLQSGHRFRFWVGAYNNNDVLIDHGQTEAWVYGGEDILVYI